MTDISGEPPKAVNPYKVLKLSETATSAEIKTAYKKLALKHHPGKCFYGYLSHPKIVNLTLLS